MLATANLKAVRHHRRAAWLGASSTLAIAVALAAGPTTPARAAVITSGDVFGVPNVSTFLGIGNVAFGSMTINAASTVATTHGSNIGNSPTGTGLVSVSDPGSQWAVGSNNGSGLNVGESGGSGGLFISNGGRVITDATPTLDPIISGKYVNVGDAGGTGSITVQSGGSLVIRDTLLSGNREELNVGGGYNGPGFGQLFLTGAGSTIDIDGNGAAFTVGRIGGVGRATISNDSVLTLDGNGSHTNIGVGIDGGSGALIVTNNGLVQSSSLQSTGLDIGRNNGTGSVVINAGGLVSLSNTGAGFGTYVNVGTDFQPSGNAQLTIQSGGQLVLNGADYANIVTGSTSPSSAATLVDGAGSAIILDGGSNYIGVGRQGTRGSLTIANNAVVSATSDVASSYLEIGQSGGTGSVFIGSGGTLSMHGTGAGRADVNVGARHSGGGNGDLLLSGGTLTVKSDNNHAFMNVSTAAGMTARADIGSNSMIQIAGTFAGASLGGSFMGGSGNGAMYITNNGLVDIRGGAVGATFAVGADAATDSGSLGIRSGGLLKIAGGGYTNLRVGQNGGSGLLNVIDGGVDISSTGSGAALDVGQNLGTGFANVHNATINVSGQGDRGSINVGTANGSGTAIFSNTNANVSGGHATLGVGSFSGGTGVVTASNGTHILLNGLGGTPGFTGQATVQVGISGTGTLTLDTGSTVTAMGTAFNTDLRVGQSNGDGRVVIDGNNTRMTIQSAPTSTFSANLDLGSASSPVSGSGRVDVRNGGRLEFLSAQADASGVVGARNGHVAALTIDSGFLSMQGLRSSLTVGNIGDGSTVFRSDAVRVIRATAVDRDASLSVGFNGGAGTLTVDNSGLFMFSQRNTFVDIGSPYGSQGRGVMTVQNTGSVFVSAAGTVNFNVGSNVGQAALAVQGDSQLNISGMGSTLRVGTRGAGTASITGAGSTVNVQGSTLGALAIVGTETGTGGLLISGGTLNIATGGSSGNNAQMLVGATGATGSVAVNASGAINIDATGLNAAAVALIGNGAGGVGSLSMTDSRAVITSQQGSAFALIGANGATGSATLTNSTFEVTRAAGPGANRFAALNVGNGTGGNGSLNLFNSDILVRSQVGVAQLVVGLQANGTMTVDSASTVTVASAGGGGQNAIFAVGSTPTGAGNLDVNGGVVTISNTGGHALDGAAMSVGSNSNGVNQLTVRNGGRVSMTAAAGQTNLLVSGAAPGASTILVTGSGSLIESEDLVTVGSATRNGDLLITNGGMVRGPAGTVGALGRMGGNGTYDGNITSAGTLDVFSHTGPGVAADFHITNSLTMTGGALNIDIFGAGAGQYDRLLTGGNLALSDSLFNFVMAPMFTAQVGDVFRFLTYVGSLTMTNMNFNVANGGGLTYALGSDATSVFLEVIQAPVGAPAPGAALLLALGVVGLRIARRRKSATRQ